MRVVYDHPLFLVQALSYPEKNARIGSLEYIIESVFAAPMLVTKSIATEAPDWGRSAS